MHNMGPNQNHFKFARNFSRIIYLFFFFMLLSIESNSQDMDCEALINYRDNGLAEIWETKQEKFKIKKEAIADIEKIKGDLLSETKYASSDIQPILLTIKSLANVIEDAIGLASPQGKMINMAKQAGTVSVRSEKVYKLIKSGRGALEASMSDDVETTLAKQATLDLAKANSGLAFFVNIHDNIKSFQDFSDLRGDIRTQLVQIEASLAKHNAQLSKPYSDFIEINNYKNYIDTYLSENCKTEEDNVIETGSTDSEAKIGYIVGVAHEYKGSCVTSQLAFNQEVKFTNKVYGKIWEDMTKAMRQKYPSPQYQFPTKTVVLPGNSVIVFSYRVKKSDCESNVISYSKAKTFEEASKAIDKRMKECKDCYGYSEIERWPRPN